MRIYLQCGQARAAARVQAIAGQALRLWGRNAEARDQLTAAMEVLRADPDRDTVRALDQLATVAVFSGSPDADQLSAEALALGQDLDVDAGLLGGLLADPRDLPGSVRAAPAGDRVPPGERAPGHPGRRQPQPGARAEQPVARAWGLPIPRRPRRRPAPRPVTCAGPGPGTTWPSRSSTWARPCSCSATGTPPRPNSPRPTPTAWPSNRSSSPSRPGWPRCAATPTGPRPC